ncbi:MAG: hypothetical protein HC880_05600 [Bacteroidia bacterium]|nr:hypothetical protein [Bacteroidia bacterium]
MTFSPGTLNFTVNQGATTPNQNATLSVNEGTPTKITLRKNFRSAWLNLPANPALGALSFGINAGGLAPGSYTDTVRAAAFGYADAPLIVKLQVNAINPAPPVVTVSFIGQENSPGVFKNQAIARIQASDANGIQSIEYSINDGPWKAYLTELLFNEAGTFRLKARATDNSSAVSTTGNYAFEVVRTALNNNKMVLENLDKFPENDELSFSRVIDPTTRTLLGDCHEPNRAPGQPRPGNPAHPQPGPG